MRPGFGQFNVPPAPLFQVTLDGAHRDEQTENVIYTVRNMDRAGIPIFGYC